MDREDCFAVFTTGRVNAEEFLERYSEAARYDLNPQKVMRNLIYLAEGLRELELISDDFFEKARSCV